MRCKNCGKYKEKNKECFCQPELEKKEQAIKFLQEQGYKISKEEVKTDKIFKIDLKRFTGEVIKFGYVTDTHLCSKYQQITHLKMFYKLCKNLGINLVVHSGDLGAGDGKIYKGQEFELFLFGADAQVEYIVNNYPQEEKIETYVISGNHDAGFYVRGGLDLVKKIAGERKDIKYLGMYGAFLDLKGIKIYLAHGDGGNAYARSYKMQKRIEQFSPQDKPDMYLLGHYHTVCELPMYRNVVGIQGGCFESQTPYLRRKGIYPEIGGHIIELKINTEDRKLPGIVHLKTQFIPFYVPRKDDY